MKTTYTVSQDELQKIVARYLEKKAGIVFIDPSDIIFPYATTNVIATYELEET